MADEKKQEDREPRGLGEHVRGLAGAYAHQQGWGLDEEERTKLPEGKPDFFGGKNFEYGARDFGDEAVNTESTESEEESEHRQPHHEDACSRPTT